LKIFLPQKFSFLKNNTKKISVKIISIERDFSCIFFIKSSLNEGRFEGYLHFLWDIAKHKWKNSLIKIFILRSIFSYFQLKIQVLDTLFQYKQYFTKKILMKRVILSLYKDSIIQIPFIPFFHKAKELKFLIFTLIL